MYHFQQQIHQWLQHNQQSAIELLKTLVQQPSIQTNEARAQAIVIEKLKELQLEIDSWEPGETITTHEYFYSPRKEFIGSPNVVAIKRGTCGGRSIILNGHIDVVPEGDLGQWDSEPFSGEIKDGKLYGRGSTDMKGGNVSLLLAIEVLQALGIKLKGDIIFQSVIEEESGGAGTLAAILRGYNADAAIIPEPTNMRIFPKQQGSMWFRLKVKGRSAHGGTRYEGVSAIDKAFIVTKYLHELEKKRNERITDPLYEKVPIPIPINIGMIQGGKWPSSVADLVTLEGRMGVAPEETMDNAKQELQHWLTKLGEKDEWFSTNPVSLEWFGARWVPGTIPLNHPLMTILTDQYKKVLARDPVIEASPWGTDGGLLDKVGNIPTIVFGPGTTEVAHFPNEYIVLKQVFETAEIIALTLINWCGVDEQ